MTITSVHDTSAAAAQPTPHSGERLVRRAMLDTYLKPIYSHLAGDVTEVAINKPGEIWTEGPTGWISHSAPELTYQSCLHIGQLIATYNEKDISIDRPILSAALPDGERVQVIIPPACLANTVSMTIRKPSMTDKTLDELEESGAFAEVDDASDGLRPFEIELLELKKKRLHNLMKMVDALLCLRQLVRASWAILKRLTACEEVIRS